MILINDCKHYAEIILNRPEVHNAFNPEMILAITNAFRSVSQNTNYRFVLLKANGKSFCAGGDLNWMKSMLNYTQQENQEDAIKLFEMFQSIYECKIPSIAYAHGNIMGGGIGLIAACDIVLLEQSANLAFTEVKWGLVPATIGPFVMQKLNMSNALDYMLSAKNFSAQRAKEISLANFVGSESECLAELENYKKSFFQNAPEAVVECKKMIRHIHNQKPVDVKKWTADLIAARRVSKEGQAGLNLFLNKQKVFWTIE